jgi:hypothetical protein
MVAFTPNYQIAAGNNNAAGLTLVSSLTDSNGVKLVMPRAWPFHEEGELVIAANATPSYRGFDTQDWLFSVLTKAQYYLLRSTYTGLVTIKTDITNAFANYNASAWIDQKSAGDFVYLQGSVYDAGFTGPGLRGIRLHLFLTEAL